MFCLQSTFLSSAEEKASKVLIGEFFRMSLKKPMNSHAEHLRVASVVPLSSSFVPIIETLKTIYQVDDLTTVSMTAESVQAQET